MTEKTTIDPSEIREGDTIRWEGLDHQDRTRLAIEYIAHHDGDHRGWLEDGGEYYLLKRFERPTSPVPDVETLGYVHLGGRLILGVWRTHDYRPRMDGVGRSAIQWERDIPVDQVTGFTPAIAIPDLDEERLQELADVFRAEWHAADERGEAGERTEAALTAVFQSLMPSRERAVAAQLDALDVADEAREADQ